MGTQSNAIVRWAGRKSSLYPDDPLAALAVDEVLDICADLATKCPQNPDVEAKKAARAEYAAGKMKALASVLAERASSNEFIAGPEITVADLVLLFGVLDGVRTGNWDFI